MPEKQTSPNPAPDSASTDGTAQPLKKVTDAGASVGADQVQKAVDQANEQGYVGDKPEGSPENDAFTVEGVTKAAKDANDGT